MKTTVEITSVANSGITSIGLDATPVHHYRQHFAGRVRGVVQPKNRKRVVPLQRVGVAAVQSAGAAVGASSQRWGVVRALRLWRHHTLALVGGDGYEPLD